MQSLSTIQLEINNKKAKVKELYNTISSIRKNIERLEKEKEKRAKNVFVTDHCIQRFSERVEKLPKHAIKSIFYEHELTKLILKNGNGRYLLPNRPDCIVLVRDNTMITCYKCNVIERKINKLKRYMAYYIDCKAAQLQTDEPHPIKSFEEFDKYKNFIGN